MVAVFRKRFDPKQALPKVGRMTAGWCVDPPSCDTAWLGVRYWAL